MSPAHDEISQLVEATATRLFKRYGLFKQQSSTALPTEYQFDENAWGEMLDAGLAHALLNEDDAQLGIDTGFLVARLSGMHAVTMPLVESLAANWLLVRAGLPITDRPCTIAEQPALLSNTREKLHLSGRAHAVPWGGACDLVLLSVGGDDRYLVHLGAHQYSVQSQSNIAGEPRVACIIDTPITSEQLIQLPAGWNPHSIRLIGAALRSAQMAGAIEAALLMTVAYATERRQFGRSIGSFQAVQQLLAVMATQAASARVAADIAAIATYNDLDGAGIAVAKARVGEAAGIVAAGAHQVHGALGFTREYALNLLTRRLWAWRDDYGGEAEWCMLLGQRIAAMGSEQLWPVLTEI